MGIYDRDNISYSNLLNNELKNRLEKAYRESNRIEQMAKNRGQAAKDIASTFARGMDYAQYVSEQSELENKLKDLESRRDTIRNAYTQSQDYQPYTTTPSYKASEYMSGYKNYDSAKDQWLQAHPGMTEEDYEQFVAYQNALYGGR